MTRRPIDPIDRAHLTGASRPTPPIARYAPAAELADLVERYWVPVWSLEAPQQQSTLQHPACLIVVSNAYARCYGVTRGLSTVVLEGTGWALGVMLRPGAGAHLTGRSAAGLADRFVEVTEVPGFDDALVGDIRSVMAPPEDPASHTAGIALLEERLVAHCPLDGEGRLVNEVVGWISDHPEVMRVGEVAAHFGIHERTLHRLVLRRVGMTPKWLLQRRRLHEAVLRLKAGEVALADMAAELGYADQAHFTHDFKMVTGMTPGTYLADQRLTGRGERSAPR